MTDLHAPHRRPTSAPPRLAVPGAGALVPPAREVHGRGRAERASRRILRAALVLLVAGLVAALFVPITRTVALDGHLVPEHTHIVRAAEPGLIADVLVSTGDTVEPGQLVARLRSPTLDEAMRTQAPGTPRWPLLTRLARLDVHAPAWSRPRADGSADPSSLFPGGIVLTERLDEKRGERVAAGDAILEVAAVDAGDRVPFLVEGVAGERQAQRIRPGMPARVTIQAVPVEHPRQIPGTVRRVAPAPDASGTWRVEIEIDAREVETATAVPGTRLPTVLRSGFSVQVAVREHRAPLARSFSDWLYERLARR